MGTTAPRYPESRKQSLIERYKENQRLSFDPARRLHDPQTPHDMGMLLSANGCLDKVQIFQPLIAAPSLGQPTSQ